MTKIRVWGTMEEIDAAIAVLRQGYHLVNLSRAYKNRNSDGYRMYFELEPIAAAAEREVELTPSYHGEKCLGNGEYPGIECCCDECDHYLECFPEWRG